MTSPNDVHRLRREGLSIRQIAARLGLSRTKVHRWASRPPHFECDGDGLALLDATEEERLSRPLVFVGLNGPTPIRGGERYVDARGVSFDSLALYRWGQHDATPEEKRASRADLDAQIREAGLVLVAGGDGYWYWYASDQITPEMELIPEEDPWGRTSTAVPHYRVRRES